MATLHRYKRGHTPQIQKGAKTSNSGVERNAIRYRGPLGTVKVKYLGLTQGDGDVDGGENDDVCSCTTARILDKVFSDEAHYRYISEAINSAFAAHGRRKKPKGNTNTGGRTSPDGSPCPASALSSAATPVAMAAASSVPKTTASPAPNSDGLAKSQSGVQVCTGDGLWEISSECMSGVQVCTGDGLWEISSECMSGVQVCTGDGLWEISSECMSGVQVCTGDGLWEISSECMSGVQVCTGDGCGST